MGFRDVKEAHIHLVPSDGQPSAVNRAIDVLEALVDSGAEVGLADLSGRVGVPKPTVHRILQTLIGRGYARQRSEGVYAPGLRTLAIAGVIWANMDIGDVVRPIMADLQEILPETVHFAVFDTVQAVYVEKLEGKRAYRMASVVGMPITLHSTAIGKSILAFLNADEFSRWAGSAVLSRRTAHTITSRRQLETDLITTRRLGYAIDDEENERDTRCVGAAVFDARGRVFGGISLSAPIFQLTREEADRIGPNIALAAARISIIVGLPPASLPAPYAAVLATPPAREAMPRSSRNSTRP